MELKKYGVIHNHKIYSFWADYEGALSTTIELNKVLNISGVLMEFEKISIIEKFKNFKEVRIY